MECKELGEVGTWDSTPPLGCTGGWVHTTHEGIALYHTDDLFLQMENINTGEWSRSDEVVIMQNVNLHCEAVCMWIDMLQMGYLCRRGRLSRESQGHTPGLLRREDQKLRTCCRRQAGAQPRRSTATTTSVEDCTARLG